YLFGALVIFSVVWGRDFSRFLGPGRRDAASGRASQSRRYGRMHSGRERRVHLEVTWFSVCCAFDFRYATELVIVTHELFALASTRREATNRAEPSTKDMTAPKWSTATSKPNDRPPKRQTPSINPGQEVRNSY